MRDDYSYLRSQYASILEHCEYLLRSSADPKILAQANESKQRALYELQRLNRQNA
jgi:hypothetical protein